MTAAVAKVVLITEPSNGGQEVIEQSLPYGVSVTVEGACDYLFHRWNPEAVEEKARAGKNSKGKKTDNLESYVMRLEDGTLAIPGDQFRGSIINAARFRQDPRSPRKSASDLVKAAVVSTTLGASLGIKDWDYAHKCRVTVQRQGINRVRPAIRVGWRGTFDLMVTLPEWIDSVALREIIEMAGRVCGVGDYRPTYGRFGIVGWQVRRL